MAQTSSLPTTRSRTGNGRSGLAPSSSSKSKGPVRLDRLPLAQGLDYIGKSITDARLKTELAHGVQDQKIEMVAIGFYDDCAEDGDVVHVQSGGVDVTVPLYHQVQYVELPVPKGGQAVVTVSGIRDGTGRHHARHGDAVGGCTYAPTAAR